MRARPISCCFSGHRPGKLPWGDDEGDRRCLALKERLWNEMEAAYERGYRHFICGMAQGCDLYFCELALALRQLHGDVTVEAAIPCPSQAEGCTEIGHICRSTQHDVKTVLHVIHNHRTMFLLQLSDRTVSFALGKKFHYVPRMWAMQ